MGAISSHCVERDWLAASFACFGPAPQPSPYISSTCSEEAGDKFCVRLVDSERSHTCVFTDFSAAVVDHVLFSFGKGRVPLNAAPAREPHISNDSAQVKSLRPRTSMSPSGNVLGATPKHLPRRWASTTFPDTFNGWGILSCTRSN